MSNYDAVCTIGVSDRLLFANHFGGKKNVDHLKF
jgi:hypothetical protein